MVVSTLSPAMFRYSVRPLATHCQAVALSARRPESTLARDPPPSTSKNATGTESAHMSMTNSGIAQVPGLSSVVGEDGLDATDNLPRSLQALRLKPLKREAEYGIPSCDLQLRSYSLQPLEFFADFALRAAYYLGLPAYGPVPLPRITERWTVPKSHFIFKKAQENFERRTLRRLIQIKDGHPETVQIWLAYLRKHQYYGIGMKANMWEFTEMGVGQKMAARTNMGDLDAAWSHLGQTKKIGAVAEVEELLESRRLKENVGLTEQPRTKLSSLKLL